MTVLIWALDGLDIRYVRERNLLSSLSPSELHNDLEGANALFTHRIWPAIWRGINGGKSETNEVARYKSPDDYYVWENYAATVMLAPVEHGRYSQYQNQFPDDYQESLGPRGRLDEAQWMFRDGIENAADDGAQVIIAGSKMPDIAGHLENNAKRAEQKIVDACRLAEETANYSEIDDYLVVSDHGFKIDEIGNKPSGVDAHSRHGTIASSFADYEEMSNFIVGWHDDLHEAVVTSSLKELGYT